MDLMARYPDKHFDLAIVDPPYGIEKGFQATSRVAKYSNMEYVNDCKPNFEYFKELFRVSKNQIIWGYNHFSDMLPKTKEFIFWYKHQPVISYSDGELAWTSFSKTAKCFDYPYFGSTGSDKDGRIHAAQKPIQLYKWILKTYANSGQIILDTHVGSGSIGIACHDMGFDLVGAEIDPVSYGKLVLRIKRHQEQGQLFDPKELFR